MKTWDEYQKGMVADIIEKRKKEISYINKQVGDWEYDCKGYESMFTKWQQFLYIFIIVGLMIFLYLILINGEINKINKIAFRRRITMFFILIIIAIICAFIGFAFFRVKQCVEDKKNIDELRTKLEKNIDELRTKLENDK